MYHTVQSQLAEADKHGEGPSSYQQYDANTSEFGNSQSGNNFQNTINARMVENM